MPKTDESPDFQGVESRTLRLEVPKELDFVSEVTFEFTNEIPPLKPVQIEIYRADSDEDCTE